MIAGLLVLLVIAGCNSAPRTKAGIDKNGKPKIQQNGDATTPAAASVTTTVTTVSLPAGSKVETQAAAPAAGSPAPAPVIVTLSAPSELRTETRREAVEGAKTPEPPLPPSPTALARATGLSWFYFAGVACGLAAIAMIYFGHAWAAKSLVVAAVVFPIIGNLVSSPLAMTIGCVFVALAGGLYLAWKILAARHGLDQKTTT